MLVLADYRQATGRGTRDMRQTLEQLISHGVEVRGQSGHEIRSEYLAAGRSVPAARGAMHAKSLLVDQYLIIGSTNWTISSRTNQEISVLLQLNSRGLTELDIRRAAVVKKSQLLQTVHLGHDGENTSERRSRAGRSRSASLQTHTRRVLSYDDHSR